MARLIVRSEGWAASIEQTSMTDSGALLQEYVVGRSEAAFGQLVTRHVDMVYSTALRVVGGDAHLARDVTQIVFADLAHKARSLPANLVLGGWLHQHTFFVAAQTVRAEKRRQAREKEAVFMQDSNEASSDSVWQQLAPVLDEAMARLRTRDRDAIVLRYFEQKPLRAVGQALGISEEAARKRIDRAVTALKSLLIRRGVTLSTAAIATFLSVQSVSAAPTGMAAAALASAAAAKSAAGGAGLAASVMNLVIMTKLQVTVVGLLFLAGAATPFILSSAVDSWSGRQARLQPQPPALAKGAQSVASTPAEGAQSDQLEAGSPLGRLASWLRRADQ
ncbi:MAG TPA: sigma-70 family RNA polymerase sigma factor, partial [Clostridia bacterium]|nr:sigma-70 family RNA polymerase sigma factor [Clostridia bacterium]